MNERIFLRLLLAAMMRINLGLKRPWRSFGEPVPVDETDGSHPATKFPPLADVQSTLLDPPTSWISEPVLEDISDLNGILGRGRSRLVFSQAVPGPSRANIAARASSVSSLVTRPNTDTVPVLWTGIGRRSVRCLTLGSRFGITLTT